MVHDIPVGTSEPSDFALLNAGEAVVGTGVDVELEIYLFEDGEAVLVTPPLTVGWLDQSAGTVRVTGTEDLAVGTYLVRFKLTDLGGDIGFVPNTFKADVWRVVPIGNR